MTGRRGERRARGHQRLMYLDGLCMSRKDNVNPTQLIRTSGDRERELWHHMIANVVI